MGRRGTLEAVRLFKEGQGTVGGDRSGPPGPDGPGLPEQQYCHGAAARSHVEDQWLLGICNAVRRADVELADIKAAIRCSLFALQRKSRAQAKGEAREANREER